MRARVLLAGVFLVVAAAATTTPAHAEGDETRAVEALAAQAHADYSEGRFSEAIATYLKAYEMSKSAVVLFNVATIYDKKLHERELAVEYYRRFAKAADADPELVKRATERIGALKQEAAADETKRRSAFSAIPGAAANALPGEAPARSTVTEDGSSRESDGGKADGSDRPAPPPSSESTGGPVQGGGLRSAAFVVGGVGLAGVGASFALGLLAKARNDEANGLCDGSVCSSERGVTATREAVTFATASTVAFGVGIGLVGVGVGMFFLSPSAHENHARSSRASVSPQIGAHGGGVRVEGTF